MNETIKVIPKKQVLDKKQQVAAYARVSTGKDAMLHSLSAQVSYYSNLIQGRNDWLYVGVYADEALTGTKDNRDEFQRMINDAKSGKIDLIITKSISRFARNTVTLLSTIRELKHIGVGVYFEEERIHSLSGDGELMLSILASYAQEESRSVSENMKWRIKKNFKEGLLWGTSLYGYKTVNGKLKIIPEEAKVIKWIFEWYLSGKSIRSIARKLNSKGYKTKKDNLWGKSSIRLILSNYNYTGNLILQKTYRENHLTKKNRFNNGELPKYHVEESHDEIISKEVFDKVQRELERRDSLVNRNEKQSKHPFTSLIKCDKCGMNYQRKITPYKHIWICSNYLEHGKTSCDAKQVPEETLYEITCDVLGLKEFEEDKFKKRVRGIKACDNNILVFIFADGTYEKRKWKYKSRSESWTPKMREEARRRSLKQWQEK